ncbi:MAG: HK97 family phage prohead protease [Pirellulales bacterium]|nr:HK97 family phage prohead protease [Pirellulales bacterium]
MEIERRFSPARITTRANGRQTIAGYAAVFYRPGDAATQCRLMDDAVERIRPGAFNRAPTERHDVRGLFNHDPDNLLGRTAAATLRLSVDSTGLRYEIDVDPADPDHSRVLAKIDRGDLTGSSFAFRPLKITWEENDGGDSIRWIEDLQLFDVGPVTFPAYEASSTGLRSVELEAIEAERQRHRDSERCQYVERFLKHWQLIIAAEAAEAEHDQRAAALAAMKAQL